MDQQIDSSMQNKPSSINIWGAIKWAFGGLIIGFIFASFLFAANIPGIVFWGVIIFFIALFGFLGAKSKGKKEKKAHAESKIISNDGLNTNQKVVAWVFSIINPIIAGAVMHYMWKHEHPTKARQGNHISIIALLIWLAIACFVEFYLGWEFLGFIE